MFARKNRPAIAMPRRRMRFAPTTGGLVFMIATGILGAVALQPSGNVLLLMFAAFLGALLVNGVAGWRTLGRVTIDRLLPEAAVAGSPSVIRYQLRNPRRFSSVHGLLVSEDVMNDVTGVSITVETYVPVLRRGQSLTVSAPMVWPARGRYVFSRLRVSTRFPFGLFRKTLSVTLERELIVFPTLRGLRTRLWEKDRISERTGGAEGQPGNTVGDEEFFGLREFRQGDNPRRIHWKRSARTRRLFVREMSRPRQRQFWCVVNTHAPAADAVASRRVEEIISGAATVVCDILERGGRVGLITNGQPAIISPPGSGRGLRSVLLRELARRPPNPDSTLFNCLGSAGWISRWRGPCLLFTPTVHEDVQHAARWLAARVGPVTLLVPGAPQYEALFSPHDAMHAWPDLAPIERDAHQAEAA